jgi:hypothetical protein
MPGFLFAQSWVESGMRWLLKRWWFWGGAGFMLVAVCAGYLFIPAEKARITQENCDKIQEGWSPEQVVSLLGEHEVPDYGHGPGVVMLGLVWYDQDGNAVVVKFKMNDALHVTSKEFRETKLSFYERMKRRVERRLQALWPGLFANASANRGPSLPRPPSTP